MAIGEALEVLDIVRKSNFMRSKTTPKLSVILLSDFYAALDMSFCVPKIEHGYAWQDLKALKSSEFYCLGGACENELIDQHYNQLDRLLDKAVPDLHPDAYDDVLNDLFCCFSSRFFFGKNNKFYEEMLEIYDAGCWPCGWKGDWPSGQFVVYCDGI